MNIGDSGNIFVEKAHPAYTHVIDFLISCCEPVSRTQYMEQYRMDSSSLSAATAEGTYSLAMIESVLRHFRLNAAQELPVDLERCAALERLAAALDESNGSAEVDGFRASQEALATKTASSSFAARIPLPRCLSDVDLTGTILASLNRTGADDVASPAVSAPHVSNDSWKTLVKREKVEEEAVGDRLSAGDAAASALETVSSRAAAPSGSPTSRLLQLFRPLLPTPASAAAPIHSPTTGSPLEQGTPIAARPLISLAVVRPADVHRPLPESLAQMLKEEEHASRVQIVLQPRLRRFHQFEASRGASFASTTATSRATVSKERNGAATGALADRDDQQLLYFVQSRQRAHLEHVLPALKEFLEPVVICGAERWILSDVDRSPLGNTKNIGDAERLARDAGRPAVLRLLYESPRAGTRHEKAAATPSASRFLYKCQVRDGKLREVKECLFSKFDIRADCYYDYMQDRTLHVPNLNLASHVRLRPYQVASLERFCRGRKAHQGVIVLPCGAGKTLTGIGAAATMQTTTIVMCINNMSVFQWQREFLRWTDLAEDEVTVCTAKVKQRPGKVFITTYSMVVAKRGSTDGAAAEESRAILQAMTAQPWGLLLLDEVHTALAHHFQDVLNTIKYKCVLGLSATLLREDDKIGDLRHLVGPKLYEANWLDLTCAGFLANVECAEVQCPMPPLFLQEYHDIQSTRALLGAHARLNHRGGRGGNGKRCRESVFQDDEDAGEDGDSDGEDNGARGGRGRGHDAYGSLTSRSLRLASCNPYKLWCTQALLAFHQQRSPPDKVIIFCDYLADVRFFAHHLHLPFMDRRTSEAERTNLLQYFQHSDSVNAIVLTRVGDVALDLPCASVVIQVSGLGASRRQEAQRLGRILRPKPPSLDNTCAYFYTLVSQDTADVSTSYKRQSWLRDQGFAYRILHCDRVLSEFARVGGQPCCVGPPQWWYQTHNTASATPSSETAAVADAGVVHYDGLYWAPFSVDAAALIEAAFQHGRATCTLRGGELGRGTPRPSSEELGRYPLLSSESWKVTFSSVDAPRTFGTVLIGEGAPSSSLRERRVRRGCLDRSHRCIPATADQESHCISFVRNTVLRARDTRGSDAVTEAE
ncbi:DNA repair helicase, putative [Leishmania donovani]|uniref:DNA 3'-5' helicase n=1 Tax=Leishmania donovani TaxID=5661 RepID=E9BKK7_LEIDO|nr:DNA repair helicase, putative [Leishmania donovani]AYU80546.1 DNA repair helicase and transcription factor protein, putative [Leishmania donovani]CBZ35785.1 DNA repair helicase, putative [Leishmania donovani]